MDVDVSWKFWASFAGITIGVGIAGMLLFVLIGAVWYAWGAIGALIFFGAIMLGIAYLYDRRQANRYEDEAI